MVKLLRSESNFLFLFYKPIMNSCAIYVPIQKRYLGSQNFFLKTTKNKMGDIDTQTLDATFSYHPIGTSIYRIITYDQC